MSQQRAEQRLGTQLAARQVLGRSLGGAMGGEWLWAGPCACVGRASDRKARDLTPGDGDGVGGGDQAPEHSGVRVLQVLDIIWISFDIIWSWRRSNSPCRQRTCDRCERCWALRGGRVERACPGDAHPGPWLLGRSAYGRGLGQLPGAERGPAGAASRF